jgi:hypothetical protein
VVEPTLAAKDDRINPKLSAAQPGVLQALRSEGAPLGVGEAPLASRASIDGTLVEIDTDNITPEIRASIAGNHYAETAAIRPP